MPPPNSLKYERKYGAAKSVSKKKPEKQDDEDDIFNAEYTKDVMRRTEAAMDEPNEASVASPADGKWNETS